MTKMQNSKQYDLEDRTFKFAERIRDFIKELPKSLTNTEYSKQLIRSSASVGANYIEANESFSKKDLVLRIKICRKEAKESRYWLRLVQVNSEGLEKERAFLLQEVTELTKIFGSILEKTK